MRVTNRLQRSVTALLQLISTHAHLPGHPVVRKAQKALAYAKGGAK
jgi:hypothetical protein